MASCTAVLPFDYVSHNSAIVSCREKKYAEADLQSQPGRKQSIIEVINVNEPYFRERKGSCVNNC